MQANTPPSRRHPFSDGPGQAPYIETEPHRRALAHLRYGVKQGEGVIVLTGDEGVGKTAAVDRLCRELSKDADRVLVRVNAREIEMDRFEQHLLTALKEAATVGAEDDLIGGIRRLRAEGRSVMVFIDEAQELSDENFDRVRRLASIFDDGDGIVQISLIGRTPLRNILYREEMEPLRQRILASFHLPTLTVLETATYIRRRMEWAGLNEKITFKTEALKSIATQAGGTPKRINQVADRALRRCIKERRVEVTSDDTAELVDVERPIDVSEPAVVAEPAPPSQPAEEAALKVTAPPTTRPDGRPVSFHELNAAIERLQNSSGRRTRTMSNSPSTNGTAAPEPQDTPVRENVAPAEASPKEAPAATAAPAATEPPRFPLPAAPPTGGDLWSPSQEFSDLTSARLDRQVLPKYRPTKVANREEAMEAYLADTSNALDGLRASIDSLRGQVAKLDERRQMRREKLITRIDAIKKRLDSILED